MMKKIYVSTLCFTKKNISEIIEIARENNLNIEFSSGLKHNSSNIDFFNQLKTTSKLIHNYFPAPKDQFVINLASTNKEIRELSINHCISNLNLSAENNLMFYSAHAGFCIDPKPDKLGGFIQVKKDFNRSEHIDIFIDSLNKILDVATSLKISFYVENNVISRKNYLGNGYTNPFLCCDSEEINNIFKKINHNNLGLLLDTGHLKVSSSTLGLNPEKEVNKVLNYVCAVHHSDNNGKVDSNEILDENYWFLKFKKYFSLWDHVIEVRNLSPKQIKEQINIIN